MVGTEWLQRGYRGCGRDRVAVMAKGQQLCEDKAAVVAGGHDLVANVRMEWLW